MDVGCGSGQWVVEVAEQYPMTAVLGVDISPVQPFSAPENCKFFLGNLSEGLDFNDGTMDLVQSRYRRCVIVYSRILMAGVTKEKWPGYLEEVYRIVKPGTGWAQMIETSAFLVCDDDSVPEDAPIWEVDLNPACIDSSFSATCVNCMKSRSLYILHRTILNTICGMLDLPIYRS